MGWNEGTGTVTRAFDDWKPSDTEIRVFLSMTSRLTAAEFDRVWHKVKVGQPGDPGDWTAYVAVRDSIGGPDPSDLTWMLHSMTIREAVTIFEVYLEKAIDEVLWKHGLRLRPGSIVRWHDMSRFYKQHLGIEVETNEVRQIRDLRHLLTHQRGELRTTGQREQFGRSPDGDAGIRAVLSEEHVIGDLDVLAAIVRRVDPVAWLFSWGDERSRSLVELIESGAFDRRGGR